MTAGHLIHRGAWSLATLWWCAFVAVPVSGLFQSGDRPSTAIEVEVSSLLAEGRYVEAEKAAQREFDSVAQSTSDQARVADDADRLVRSLVLNGKGSLPSTVSTAELAVRIRRSVPSASTRLSGSLTNLGDVLAEDTQYARAVNVLDESLALQSRQQDGCDGTCLATLNSLGSVLIRMGRYEDALLALRRSVAAQESVPQSREQLARTLQLITLALIWKGDYPVAHQTLTRAFDLQTEATHLPLYAEGLALLGQIYWYEGDLLQARDTSRQALTLTMAALRPDHPDISRVMRTLAATMLDLGEIAEAQRLQQQALVIMERSMGPTHAEIAPCLNALAESELLVGSYAKARALYERALTIAEAKLGPNHDWVATFIHNLALVDARVGDYQAATREHERALAIWERVFSPTHPIVAVSLSEMATVLRETGDAPQALVLLKRALSIRESALGPTHRDTAKTLADVAATLAQMGRVSAAESYSSRALRIWEELAIPDTPDFANMLLLHGDLLLELGKSTAAQRFYERAIEIRTRTLSVSHPLVAEAHLRLALVTARLGDIPAATRIATAADAAGRDHLRLMLRYLPERQAIDYARTRPSGVDLLLTLATMNPAASLAAIEGVVTSRALVLDEMARRNSSALGASGSQSMLVVRLLAARQRVANLLVRTPGVGKEQQYLEMLRDANREKEQLERNVAAERASSEPGEDGQVPDVEVSALLRALPRAVALVSFAEYEDVAALQPRSHGERMTPQMTAGAARRYVALIFRADRAQPAVVALGNATTVDRTVEDWRNAVVGLRSPMASRERAYREVGSALRRRVWDPIEPHLAGIERVFIVPDGSLNLVAFAALPVGTQGYMVERLPAIHYLSAERDVLGFKGEASKGIGLLALGGAAFESDASNSTRSTAPAGASDEPSSYRSSKPSCSAFEEMAFLDLPASQMEVSDVAQLWKTIGSGSYRLLTGAAADEASFKRFGPGSNVLHLATHGFFLAGECEPTVAGTRSVGGLSPRTQSGASKRTGKSRPKSLEEARIADNPLLLSGLALAGANRRTAAGPDEEDGILTAEEVASLDLSGVEWAVLSACDTGLGEIKAGEGVFGLRRAFQIAGAHTVIMSLWSVEDRAAMMWMRALYEGRLARKLDTATAVREATISVLKDRRARGLSTHPFYWAGFVASGDWR